MFTRIAVILMAAVPMFALSALGYLALYRFDDWKMRRLVSKRQPQDTGQSAATARFLRSRERTRAS
jgi:hypothetical protein